MAILAAMIAIIASPSADASGKQFDYFVRSSAKLTIGKLADGSIKARAVFISQEPKCIAPGRIRFDDGEEPTPELYGLKFGEGGEYAGDQIKLPRVGPHTYELILPGTMEVTGTIDAGTHSETVTRPAAELTSVNFLARTDDSYISIMKDGKKQTVKCLGSHSEDPAVKL